MGDGIGGSSRRAFLQMASGGAFAPLAGARTLSPARTPLEEANVRVVDEFCASWKTRDLVKITSFLTENCVYRGTETAPPAIGRDAIMERVKGPVGRAEAVRFDIVETYARGPVVVNERLDYFTVQGQDRAFHAVGLFFLKDGHIAEWTDYVIRDG